MILKTEKLFYENAYLQNFNAKVISCTEFENNYKIILDKTAFYPEGGGQPSDLGFISDAKVLDVKEKNEEIFHIVDKEILENQEVFCQIDWERRFSFMQNHSGEHIISGIIKEKFGFDNVGFHMNTEIMTIDVNGILTDEQLKEIENLANDAIYKNFDVEITFPSQEILKNLPYRSKKELVGSIRIVNFEDFDICACCGTHVQKTGEIGLIKFLSKQNYKSGLRITMVCGKLAFKDYQLKNHCAYEISSMLSVKPLEIKDGVNGILKENEKLKANLNYYKEKYFNLLSDSICAKENICLFENDLDANDLRKLCLILIQKISTVILFSEVGENEFKFAFGSSSVDMHLINKKVSEKFKCRGGGQKNLVQGTLFGDKNEIQEYFDGFLVSEE